MKTALFFASKITPLVSASRRVRVVQIIQIAFARPRFFFRDAGVEQLHQVRAVRVGGVGRSRKPGGFVEREQKFILEQNGDFPKFARGGRGEFDDVHAAIVAKFQPQSKPD